MLFPKAKRIAREQGWHITNSEAFGLYKDYFFKVGDGDLLSNPEYKYIVSKIPALTDDQRQNVENELNSNKKILKYSSFEIVNDLLTITFIENLKHTPLKRVYGMLDFLVDKFVQIGVPKQSSCHTCIATKDLDYYNMNDSGIILCKKCSREIEDDFYEIERIKISEQKNYFSGFIGSLLFSLLGIIAWVLVAVYMNLLASGMAIAIAFLGIKGYDYFKGRHGKFTNLIIVLSNFLCILLSNIATVIFLLIREGLTLSDSFVELQINTTAQDTLSKNTLISFVLAFFVWIWLIFMLRDKKLYIRPADYLR